MTRPPEKPQTETERVLVMSRHLRVVALAIGFAGGLLWSHVGCLAAALHPRAPELSLAIGALALAFVSIWASREARR